MAVSIGVDVGGTKVAAGLVDAQGQLQGRESKPAPTSSAAALVDLVSELVRGLASGHEVDAVGIGLPGLVNAARDTILFAPNLPLRDVPMAAQVSDACGLPVVLANDANAAAWAESRFGAGRGCDDMVMITIGTGVGGGLVLGGRLYRGAGGLAGEIGHMSLDPGGPVCGCGRRGCWEMLASGSALEELARARAGAHPNEAKVLLGLAGGDPKAIEGPQVTQAARAGDQVSIQVLDEVGRWLGRGMANMAALLDVSRFVVGGGVGEAADLLLGPARDSLRDNLMAGDYRSVPEVVPATLGQAAGIIGAGDLAHQEIVAPGQA